MCRPETVESLFVAYRLTGDDIYREYGWKIFQSIEKYCRVESGGYVTILDVEDVGSGYVDKMETFFLVRINFFSLLLSHLKSYTYTMLFFLMYRARL